MNEKTATADILITNGIVLPMTDEQPIIENGAVLVSGNAIESVGPADAFADFKPSRIIDARGGIVMPGLVNTHTHAAMTCFRGIADDLPLMTWLNDHIFPAESSLDAEKVHAGAMLACAEMILSGTTCFCDMYLFEDAVAEASRQAGVRAVVGEVLFDFPSPNYGPIEKGLLYSEELAQKWKDDPLIQIAVEPHSPYLCAPELLKDAAALAEQHGLLLVMHVSETEAEVAQIQEKYGRTPVGHLAELGILAPNLLADHCVVLTDEDIQLLADLQVKAAHNPESNMKLASGIAPVPELLEAGVCVGLGTDGCSSNNNLDMFSEMDMAAKLHKAATLDPTVMSARTVLKMATIEGAKALGLEKQIGSLVPGKQADLIIVSTDAPHMIPMYHPESHLVYSARGSDVRTVMINGQIVMEDRQLLTIDVEKAMREVNAVAASIRNKS